jgi:hypothetical protein
MHLPCEPTRSTLNIIWSCGLFEGKGVYRYLYTSRVSPPGPLSMSTGTHHVGHNEVQLQHEAPLSLSKLGAALGQYAHAAFEPHL